MGFPICGNRHTTSSGSWHRLAPTYIDKKDIANLCTYHSSLLKYAKNLDILENLVIFNFNKPVYLNQLWIGRNIYPPTLIVRQHETKLVQLVHRHQVNQTLNILLCTKVSRHIQSESTILIPRLVLQVEWIQWFRSCLFESVEDA